MGALTPTAGVWYPDEEDKMEINTLMGTMASSIENGLGERMNLQETFTGCHLRVPNAVLADATIRIVPFAVQTDGYSFKSNDIAVNAGRVTIPYDGIYQINFQANFLGTSTALARINTYIFVNGAQAGYSSGVTEPATNRYANCNMVSIYKLLAGAIVDVRTAAYDNTANLQPDQGSAFSLALVSRSK